MAAKLYAATVILLLLISIASHAAADESSPSSQQCGSGSKGHCHNQSEALKLKLIAICSILVTSMIGVCLPLLSRSVPALHPDKEMFVIVKAFASGVILATGYMHVLPDAFDDLTSECLPETPWRKFPFTTFVAMLSAVLTLMVDSFSMSHYRKYFAPAAGGRDEENSTNVGSQVQNFGHGPAHDIVNDENATVDSRLLRYRVVAQVLELGIVVHSVVIGLSMGALDNQCTIKPLIAALCFHQLFEGMGLGGCILQAEYGRKMKLIMVFFFSATTPFGIALGIGLSNVYSEDSPTALIVVGVLNAASAGLLNYMALVDLLAADFMGPKLQGNVKLQIWAYISVLLGLGLMSLMAKWA